MANSNNNFVQWFRDAAPYINAFRGKTFVVVFQGEAVQDPEFPTLIHDFALLNSLGIRLVLVHGSRPQIESRLKAQGLKSHYHQGLRITDDKALACVKEANGTTRVDIESQLSMGLSNSPMAGARIRVNSGNFVTARPLGVRDGVDLLHTGEVRRIDGDGIEQQLDKGSIVLLSPLGYSPTGEVFNLSAEDVATSTAIILRADKVLYLTEGDSLKGLRKMRELSVEEAQQLIGGRRKLSQGLRDILHSSVNLCLNGIKRVHIINRSAEGALLQELFTRDGIGTLINADRYERTREAMTDDITGIIDLIRPLEEADILVRRSRELLEMEIKHFTVVERDGMIIACAALYPFAKEKAGELACLAVHPDYRNTGRGDDLLRFIEAQARQEGLDKLFVLSTRASHWFQERGYRKADIKNLPMQRKNLYNYQRNSKVFMKSLG